MRLLEFVATLFAVFVRHVSTWEEMMSDCTLLWRPVELFNNAQCALNSHPGFTFRCAWNPSRNVFLKRFRSGTANSWLRPTVALGPILPLVI